MFKKFSVLFLSLIVACMFAFVGCSDDGDDDTPNAPAVGCCIVDGTDTAIDWGEGYNMPVDCEGYYGSGNGYTWNTTACEDLEDYLGKCVTSTYTYWYFSGTNIADAAAAQAACTALSGEWTAAE